MHTKSAAKRARQYKVRRLSNRGERSLVMTARRRFFDAAEGGDKDKALQEFRVYCSILDKAAKKGGIKANNASRRKSRAAARLAAIGKA